jgi:D-alanyl-D-alanine carboxypeptidase (penicillin-binding protein 5/6)
VSRIRKAVTGRPALTLCAATLTATAALTASPVSSVAHARDRASAPPREVSTVGGVRLGESGTQVAAGAPELPNLTAKSWIISDLDTGEVLASHDAHLPLPPASTLKMLFADTLIGKFPKDETHVVEPSDLDGMGAGSSLVGIVPHMSYTVQDLWRGVFLRSGNDAVHVLAAMNGGVADTVADMQDKADELRAYDTHVVTPDGYDEPGQVSSAYDLSLFARAGLHNPDFREYCSTVSAQFPGAYKKGTKDRESFAIQNTDRLLAGDPTFGLKPYPGIQGVKNGYTTDAGNTYTGLADRDGVKLLVTVMHPTAGGDEVYKEAASLLDWGFKADGSVDPVGRLVNPKQDPDDSGQPVDHTGGGSTPAPKAKSGHTTTAAVESGGSGGMWTAAGITSGLLVVAAAVSLAVRRRWPNPTVIRRRQRP